MQVPGRLEHVFRSSGPIVGASPASARSLAIAAAGPCRPFYLQVGAWHWTNWIAPLRAAFFIFRSRISRQPLEKCHRVQWLVIGCWVDFLQSFVVPFNCPPSRPFVRLGANDTSRALCDSSLARDTRTKDHHPGRVRLTIIVPVINPSAPRSSPRHFLVHSMGFLYFLGRRSLRILRI